MVVNLYTADLQKENPEDLSQDIQLAILQLKEWSPTQKIEVYSWDQNYVIISIDVEVNIPTRGTVDAIDIREVEPICLILHRRNFPIKPPLSGRIEETFLRTSCRILIPGHLAVQQVFVFTEVGWKIGLPNIPLLSLLIGLGAGYVMLREAI